MSRDIRVFVVKSFVWLTLILVGSFVANRHASDIALAWFVFGWSPVLLLAGIRWIRAAPN